MLKQFMMSDFTSYMLSLSSILCNEGDPSWAACRQLGGILLKNALDARSHELKDERVAAWKNMPVEQRSVVKENMFKSLFSATKTVRQGAAQVIGKISHIELPSDLWPELITLLLENMSQPGNSALFKEGILMTLGYICEDMEQDGINVAQTNMMLTAVVQGMAANEEIIVRRAAVVALRDALEFVQSNFENSSERDFIMQMVCTGAVDADEEMKNESMGCLGDIAELYYEHLPSYMTAIFQITVAAIQNGTADDDAAMFALGFWICVAEHELEVQREMEDAAADGVPYSGGEVTHSFMTQVQGSLLPILLQCLMQQESEEDDEWNVPAAAASLLELLSKLTKDAIVAPVMAFVQEHITQGDWQKRDAATMAFGSILDGPSSDETARLVTMALPHMLGALTDSSIAVQNSSAWTLGRICEFHARVIQPAELQAMMERFVSALKSFPMVATQVLWAIRNYAEALDADDPSDVQRLQPFYPGLATEILQVALRPDASQHNLRINAYEALCALCAVAPPEMQEVSLQILQQCSERLAATFNGGAASAAAAGSTGGVDTDELQAELCAVMSEITQHLDTKIVTQQAQTLMTLYLHVLSSKPGTSHQDVLLAVEAIATSIDKEFSMFFGAFWPFLYTALTNVTEHQNCSVAVSILSNMSRALEEDLGPHCALVVQALLQNLENQNLERSVKPHILSLLGDVAMAVGEAFEPYLENVMKMLQQAGFTVLDDKDEDAMEFLDELRKSVFEAYSGILIGMTSRSNSKVRVLMPYMGSMIGLLQTVQKNITNSSEDLVDAACAFLGDVASVLSPTEKMELQQSGGVLAFLQKVTETYANDANDGEVFKRATWAMEKMREL